MGRKKNDDGLQAVDSVIEEKQEIEEKEETKVESPQSRQRRNAVKQDEKAKKENITLKKEYICKGDKVVEVTTKKNGNSYSKFLLNRAKNPHDFKLLEERLKSEGKEVKKV